MAGSSLKVVSFHIQECILGNDTESNDHGYKLHLVWGCLASPSEKQNSSVNESPEPLAMSWEYSATPVKVTAAVKGKKLKAIGAKDSVIIYSLRPA